MAEPTTPTMTRPLDYATPSRRAIGNNWPTWLTVAAVASVLVVVAVSLPLGLRTPTRGPHDPRFRCSMNMRVIGLAIQMYMNDNGGNLPDTLTRLLETQDITPETFVCDGPQDTRATGSTTQAVLDDLTAGGHLSFVYAGSGLKASGPLGSSLPADVVILIEPTSNHQGRGMNVLFGDGHSRWVTGPAVRLITDQVNAGIRPVIWPPRPATQPAARSTAPE